MTSISGPEQRAQLIQGFRDLLDYLEAHPDVPVGSFNRIVFYTDGSDEQQRADVDRIAAALGVAPGTDLPGGHYKAVAEFGPVRYEAIAIPEQRMAQTEALNTYRNNIQPETAGAAS